MTSHDSRPRHVKIPGYVSEIEGDRWWAILRTPSGDLMAEMTVPLPDDRAGVGFLFTVHRTKRGQTYLHWPQGVWTKRQVKRARIRARTMVAVLRDATS